MLRMILWKASCWWQRVRYGVLTVGTPRLKAASESKGISPAIDLVRHRRTGQVYLVEHAPYARVPGASTPYGEPREIPKERLTEVLLPAVLCTLDNFEKREAVSGNAIGTENEKLHRSRSVQWISITRDGQLSLTVRPIHRKNGGRGQSLHEEDVTVTLPCSGEDFISVVEAAWCESSVSIAG